MADKDYTPSETAMAVIEEQARDAGLWFIAETAAEAYLQQALRRLHSAVENMSSATDGVAWLIELPGPAYYGKTEEDGLSITHDHNAAVRFARREDAEATLNDIGWNDAKAVEHMWVSCPRRATPREKQDGK